MKTFRLTIPFNAVILFDAETETEAEKVIKAIGAMTFEEGAGQAEWLEEGADATDELSGVARGKRPPKVQGASVMATGPAAIIDSEAERIARENEELKRQLGII